MIELLSALYFLKSPEVCHLVEDLGLDFPDSLACRNIREDLALQCDPLYGKTFENEISELNSQRLSNLLEVYAKHNSPGKKRSFGCSVVKELTLF